MARQCPPGTVAYSIQPGDTFYNLALRYQTTVPAIVAANPALNPNLLQVGQVICLPVQQPEFPPCPEGNYYTIQPGDTLYGVAVRFNVSLADLMEANPYVDPYRLRVGQVICIPVAVPPVTCPSGSKSYTIQPGDTFYSLAQRFQVSLDAMLEFNPGVDPDALLVGQTICIPKTI